MTLAWNLVSKHITPHPQVQDKIRDKITKLEQHLQHFPPDAVHLLINLERHPKTEVFTASLTLRLPSNILRSAKEAKLDPIPAFDKAIKALLRELDGLKSDLRHEAAWRRKGSRIGLRLLKPLRFANEPHPAGPQTFRDTLAEMIKRYHGRLLYQVQRQLHRDVIDGEIPRGAIRSEVVVDEVVRQALSSPQSKPEEISYRMWLYSLVRRELKRRYRQLRLDGVRNVPIDEVAQVSEEEGEAQGYDAEQPLEIIEQRLEPEVIVRGDLMPDEHNASPSDVAEEHDLIDFLHHATASWPEKERAVFDLHFLEGFDADEVALLESLKPAEASSMIDNVQSRLRGLLVGATEKWGRSKSKPSSRATL